MKWYELSPSRFEMEKNLLGQHHPGCKLVKKNGQFSAYLKIQTTKRCYELKAVFPDVFPNRPMKVQIESPKITDDPPHFFRGNQGLCIYGDDNYGPQTTCKVYLDWAKQWIKCYEEWQETGKWPKTNRRKYRSGEKQ